MARHIVCLTFDFDTQSGFIARGMTTPTPLSRGEFGALASHRILDFLASRAIKTTWFIPGFTIESWPRECEAVVKAGHEVAHHSWAHIPPATQGRDEEEADLVRANEAIARLTGKKARGYRSPSWDLSDHTIDLLLAHGFSYDSSLMGSDYVPYRARRGDVVKLGEPYHFGEQTRLVAGRVPAFRVRAHPDHDPRRHAAGARGFAELVRRVPLYEKDRRLGCSDLHHAPLRDRAWLSHAGAGRHGRPADERRRDFHDDGGCRARGRKTSAASKTLKRTPVADDRRIDFGRLLDP